MATAAEDRNRAFVLEAFDTLFNRRDYAAAQRFWSPDYIQHSAHIAPGRDGLFEWVSTATAIPRVPHARARGASQLSPHFPSAPERRTDEPAFPSAVIEREAGEEAPMFVDGLFAGKKILVTGGGTGLGKAMARGFAEAGADVIISSRHEDELLAAGDTVEDERPSAGRVGLETLVAVLLHRGRSPTGLRRSTRLPAAGRAGHQYPI